MKTIFCMLLISCSIVTRIYANDIEINLSGISETEEIKKSTINESKTFKIISGYCATHMTGDDFVAMGYELGNGFRIGYGINIKPVLTLESTYTITFHESYADYNESYKLNAFDVNFKYVLLPIRKFDFYVNIGWGLDLFALEGVDVGYFSYIPNFGAGGYISLSENIDIDLGFNLNTVRIGVDEEDKLNGSYFQILLLLNTKL